MKILLTLRNIIKRIIMENKNKDKVVLIDNGHGRDTRGKCSPDKSLYEWQYAREIAAMVVAGLRDRGIDARLLVKETYNVPLPTRVKRANDICNQKGAKNVLVVSIHNNAAGADGKWHDANGWQCHVCRNASENSRRFASLLYKEAENVGLKLRRPRPKQDWWENDFYIIKYTKCPAVLTENHFQDNLNDVKYLLSQEGRENIVKLHVEAITKYIETL